MNASKIAIFVDVENLTHWVKHSGPEYLFDELKNKGSTVVRKAYGNWSQPSISSLQVSLDRLGFDLSHNFHPISGKNSADIQFTIDVIDCALRQPEIDCYVLATGDSDFSPLFRKLRNMGKEVIGVGPKSPLSKSVKSSCSQYIFTDTSSKPKRLTGTGYNKAAALARNTLRNLNGYARCAELKKRMMEVDSQFDEKKHGFTNFRKFLEHIPAIHLTPVSGSNDVMAYIELKKQKLDPSTHSILSNNMPVLKQSLLENKESTLDMYKRFLQKRQWNTVSKHRLIRAYHVLDNFEPMTRDDMEATLEHILGGELDVSTVRNCITIFMKSGLLDLSLKSGTSKFESKLWSLEKRDGYLREIDFSLLTRLLETIEEKQQTIDQAAIYQLLYSNYDKNDLNQLITDTNTSLSLLKG